MADSLTPDRIEDVPCDSGMSGDAVAEAEMFWANLPTRNLAWTSLHTHEKALVCHTIARLRAAKIERLITELKEVREAVQPLIDKADWADRQREVWNRHDLHDGYTVSISLGTCRNVRKALTPVSKGDEM